MIPSVGDKEATCSKCGCSECYESPLSEEIMRRVLAVEFRWLCYVCWHAAREKQPPFHVQFSTGWKPPYFCVYTEYEACERALELGGHWVAAPANSWVGDRLSHPGYLARRRAAILGNGASV